MSLYIFKKCILTGVCILVAAGLCGPAAAQSEDEMQILRMYYQDKDLVISPTRHPKPVAQVAENITVVTAQEIEAMNAHTVAEVLNRVAGLFVNFNRDFGAASLIYSQGSDQRHVRIFVDGIPWNYANSGAAETNPIPVGIIERIEIIKGPASSAWGSALGGVVNIITKEVGSTKKPAGCIRASYGEKDSQDYRADISGKAGSAGYYLFAGFQDTDGLEPGRGFNNSSAYGKVAVPLDNTTMKFSMGYSEPEMHLGDFPSIDITQGVDIRTFFSTVSFDSALNRELSLNLSFHHFKQKIDDMNTALGLGFWGPAGTLFVNNIYDEKTIGGSGKLVWTHGMHTAVLGMDIDRGEFEQKIYSGPFYQALGVLPTFRICPRRETWAVYANDTILINRWALTPGIRYDHDSITGGFVSPSLGVTCAMDEHTLFRGSVSRGFTAPPLSWVSGGAVFLDPNPSLDHEEVWSFQAGVESAALKYFWVKAMVFRHELDRTLQFIPSGPPGSFNQTVVNNGNVRRQGFELEAETMPISNLSFGAGFASVRLDPANENGSSDIYNGNIRVQYDDKDSLYAELFGHYIWWNVDAAFNADYDNFIWDFNLSKKIYSSEKTRTDLFFTAHNLFNGSQYIVGDSQNPERWLEGGIRFKF